MVAAPYPVSGLVPVLPAVSQPAPLGRESPLEAVLQHAALPLRFCDGEWQILLITSRETRRWILPKGWAEQGLAAHDVAEQEAFEEAGVRGRVGIRPVTRYAARKRLAWSRVIPCTVSVFPLHVTEELSIWPEQAARQRRWMSPGQAALAVDDRGLIELFLTLSWLGSRDYPFKLH